MANDLECFGALAELGGLRRARVKIHRLEHDHVRRRRGRRRDEVGPPTELPGGVAVPQEVIRGGQLEEPRTRPAGVGALY